MIILHCEKIQKKISKNFKFLRKIFSFVITDKNTSHFTFYVDYAIIQVGHYSSEKLFMNLIKDLYSKKLPQIQVYCAESIGDPYNKRGEIWT